MLFFGFDQCCPSVSFIKIQNGLLLLVPAYAGRNVKEVVKEECVFVIVDAEC